MNEPQQITLKPEQLENCVCPNKDCQGVIFVLVYALKKIPKIISGSQKDVIQPIPLYVCDNCGELNMETSSPGVLSRIADMKKIPIIKNPTQNV